MRKFLFIGGFGLLPLWVGIVLIVRGGHQPNVSPDYWYFVPWFLLVAFMPCAITLGIAIATVLIFNGASGNASRKWRLASSCFFALVAVAAAVTFAIWSHQERTKEAAAREHAL